MFGQTVCDENGDELGRVRRFEDGGFHMMTAEGVSTLAWAEGKPGERTPLWRCTDCGELGDVDDVPRLCLSCGGFASKLLTAVDAAGDRPGAFHSDRPNAEA